MRVIGLTGGVATGKSTFAAELRARDVPVLDADAFARAAVAPGAPALAEIARAFGTGVIGPDGALDRKKLATIVFSDPGARRRLEAIIHPEVRRLMIAETLLLAGAGHDLAFYDVPLLYEVGLDREIEAVVVVHAPRDAQRDRLVAREGLSPAEADARLAAQLDIEHKARLADFVIDNSGPPSALGPKADRLLADLRTGRGRRLSNAPPVRY